jgi:hypothetical protein
VQHLSAQQQEADNLGDGVLSLLFCCQAPQRLD